MSYGKQQELAWLKWELESIKMPQIKTFYAFLFLREPCVFAPVGAFFTSVRYKKKSVAVSLSSEPARVSQDKISLKPLWKVVFWICGFLWSETIWSSEENKNAWHSVTMLDAALRLLRCFCVVTRVFQMVARICWVVLLSFYSLCFFLYQQMKIMCTNPFKSMCNNIYIIVHIV